MQICDVCIFDMLCMFPQSSDKHTAICSMKWSLQCCVCSNSLVTNTRLFATWNVHCLHSVYVSPVFSDKHTVLCHMKYSLLQYCVFFTNPVRNTRLFTTKIPTSGKLCMIDTIVCDMKCSLSACCACSSITSDNCTAVWHTVCACCVCSTVPVIARLFMCSMHVFTYNTGSITARLCVTCDAYIIHLLCVFPRHTARKTQLWVSSVRHVYYYVRVPPMTTLP